MVKIVDSLPEMTIGMFNTNNGKENRDARAAFDARVRYFAGPAGEEFMEGVQKGRLTSDARRDYKGTINPHFFAAFANTFKVPDGFTPEGFYRQVGRIALDVVRDLADLTGLSVSKDPFMDEMHPHSPSPTDLLYHLARLNQGRNVTLDTNVKRHFILVNIAASVGSTSESAPIDDALVNIQFEMDKRLYYRGEDGYREPYQVYTYHDLETNSFLDFAGANPEVSPDKRLLKQEFTAHRIGKVGLVYTIRNSKDPVSAVKKVIAEAHDHDGVMRPQSVKDNLRMTFVALEGNLPENQRVRQIERVHRRVLVFIRGYKDIRKIVSHNRVDNGRGQADIRWKRDDLYLEDTCVPLELVVVREGDYYDQTLEVGVVDPENGLYQGAAHPLYSIRKDVYPAIILLQDQLSAAEIMKALAAKSQQNGEDLKHIYEVEVPFYHPHAGFSSSHKRQKKMIE